MRIRSRNMFYSPDAGGAPAAAVEAPVTPVTPEAEISEQETTPETPTAHPKRGKKPAPVVTETPAETPAPPVVPDHSEELAALKAKIAELEAGTGAAQSTIAAHTESLAAYSAFAAEQAQQMLDTAPEFVKTRVKMNAENPLETIQKINELAEVYHAAKAAAKAEEPEGKPAGSASAPPPAAGSAAPKRVSVWDQAPPPGPITTRGRTKR